ncbi:MAG: transposase [Pseudomonadota bacterium]
MNATTVAVDLAKNVFQLAVADTSWKVIEQHRLTRSQFERWFQNREVSLVILEACGSAHHWGRRLNRLGIEVRLLPAAYIRAYVKRNKTDAADACALLEAARSSGITPVRIKSVEQQALQGLHRTRSLWMGARRPGAHPSQQGSLCTGQQIGAHLFRHFAGRRTLRHEPAAEQEDTAASICDAAIDQRNEEILPSAAQEIDRSSWQARSHLHRDTPITLPAASRLPLVTIGAWWADSMSARVNTNPLQMPDIRLHALTLRQTYRSVS